MPGSRVPGSRVVGGAIVVVALLSGCGGSDALEAWPAKLVGRSAGSQLGLAGFAVNTPPAVQLLDADSQPIVGAEVTFTVTSGGGSVTGGVATTGHDGVATVGGWSLANGTNTVTASIPAPFRVAPVTFAASGLSEAFQIDLRFLSAMSPSRQAAFTNAQAQWQQAIYGDIPDITVNVPAGSCNPAVAQTIDDVIIFVVLDSIDGPGGILAAAGPCYIRGADKLPLIGLMVFDTADVATLEQSGEFVEVVLHEMAHVLGFGTIWDPGYLSLLVGSAALGGTDPHFIGTQALGAFDRIGGTAYTGGAKVPVENMGGPGTEDSHWRESVFGNELMTGYLNAGVPNPLSVLTIASFGDEGYRVNYAAAESYSHTFAAPPLRAAPAGRVIALGNDVLRLPIYMVDPAGHITGVYRR